MRLKTLANEIKTLKAKDKTVEYSLALSILRLKDAQTMPLVKPPLKSYTQIAAINAA